MGRVNQSQYVDQPAVLVDSPNALARVEDGDALHFVQYQRRLVRNGHDGYPVTQRILVLDGRVVARHDLVNQ
jgi:hypothetical protein